MSNEVEFYNSVLLVVFFFGNTTYSGRFLNAVTELICLSHKYRTYTIHKTLELC